MNALAPHLYTFLQHYLPEERGASVNTCETYAYGFQLLLVFTAQNINTISSILQLEDMTSAMIAEFLKHHEQERGNVATTRNSWLAGIKAFFHYLEYRLPLCVEQSRQIQAIPSKKTVMPLVDYLIKGKGRRERVLPLWKQTLETVNSWIAVRADCLVLELFLNTRLKPMSRSGFEYILAKHVKQASKNCSTLAHKKVSPHVRAMHTLQATHDIRKVALWLGAMPVFTAQKFT